MLKQSIAEGGCALMSLSPSFSPCLNIVYFFLYLNTFFLSLNCLTVVSTPCLLHFLLILSTLTFTSFLEDVLLLSFQQLPAETHSVE